MQALAFRLAHHLNASRFTGNSRHRPLPPQQAHGRYSGSRGYVEPDCPSLAIVYENGRAQLMRKPTQQEIKATSFIGMEIEQASAKIRDLPVHDEEEDYAVPAWTALLPVRTVLGEVEECPRQMPGVTRPPGMAGYVAGRRVDEIFREAYGAYAKAFD